MSDYESPGYIEPDQHEKDERRIKNRRVSIETNPLNHIYDSPIPVGTIAEVQLLKDKHFQIPPVLYCRIIV